MDPTSPSILSPRSSLSRGDFRHGLLVALALGAVFFGLHVGDLAVNFQIDGQVPEFLAWSRAPHSWGKSLNTELNSHLYSFYYYGLAALVRLTDRMTLLAFVYGLEILAVCAGVYALAFALTRDHRAACMAVAVEVWQGGGALAPGGSSAIGLVTAAEYPATAMALVALALSWRKRHVAAALLAGAAFNAHGSLGMFACTMVVAAALCDGRGRGWIVPAGLCLLAASPTLLWIFIAPPPQAAMSTADWLRFPRWIFPNHMLPSSTPALLWMMLWLCCLPGILGLTRRLRNDAATRPIIAGWTAATVLLLSIGYVFVEVFPVRAVAQLTLFRGLRYLILVCLAFGMAHLLTCIRAGGVAALAAALTLTAYVLPMRPEFAWIGHAGLAGLLGVTALRARGVARIASLAALLGTCAILVDDLGYLRLLGDYLRWRWPIAAVGLAGIGLLALRSPRRVALAFALAALLAVNVWLLRLDVGRSFSTKYHQRAAAIRALAPFVERACPPGEIVVAPPDLRDPGAWANRGSFLCRQQLTAYAYAPWLAPEILRRMQWYLDEPVEQWPRDQVLVPRLLEGYRRRSPEAFAALHHRYGVRLAIVEKTQSLPFARVTANDTFTVYDLAAPRSQTPDTIAGAKERATPFPSRAHFPSRDREGAVQTRSPTKHSLPGSTTVSPPADSGSAFGGTATPLPYGRGSEKQTPDAIARAKERSTP